MIIETSAYDVHAHVYLLFLYSFFFPSHPPKHVSNTDKAEMYV